MYLAQQYFTDTYELPLSQLQSILWQRTAKEKWAEVFHPRPPDSHNLIFDWGTLSSFCQIFSNVWLLTNVHFKGRHRLNSHENIDFVVERQYAADEQYSTELWYCTVKYISYTYVNCLMQKQSVQYLIRNKYQSGIRITQNKRNGATWTSFHAKCM
jgi:hypothetical protein